MRNVKWELHKTLTNNIHNPGAQIFNIRKIPTDLIQCRFQGLTSKAHSVGEGE